MGNANYLFDMQWALKYLEDLEKFIKNNQSYMAKSTIQRVRETLETYGRPGYEASFDKIRLIEFALDSGQDPKDLITSLRADINFRLKP